MADQLPIFHVVGFTGHRQLRDAAGLERVMREVLGNLRAEAGVEWIALSSAAAGSDILFARCALALGMGWEAVLPLPPAEFRRDFSDTDWREVETLLSEAEHVRVISERGLREDAYLDGGMETVNHCDLLLAIWDGEPSRGRGGTAEIVAYARELKRPLIILDAKTHAVRRENFHQLKIGDHHISELNRLPLVGHSNAKGGDDKRQLVMAFHLKVDEAATQGAPQFRRLLSASTILGFFATALAASVVAFHVHHPALIWSQLTCLFGALALATVVRRRRHQQDWVRGRLATEITRSALATWGLPRALRLFDDFDWVGLEPLRRSLDILQRRATRTHPVNFDEFKQRYIHERIDAQLAYFEIQESKAVPLLARLRSGFVISSFLAIAVVLAGALHAALGDPLMKGWMEAGVFVFGPIVLPVLAAGFIALISINDLHRRVARCHEMRIRLETARKEVAFVQTWGALERVVAKAERALLKEVFEWHSITSFTETR